VFNLVQMVVLNYIALHEADAPTAFANLYPAAAQNNTLGTGSTLSPLIAYQPLAGLVNGRIVG
jgi:hypothetical protein